MSKTARKITPSHFLSCDRADGYAFAAAGGDHGGGFLNGLAASLGSGLAAHAASAAVNRGPGDEGNLALQRSICESP